MFAIFADQKRSRTSDDAVSAVIERLELEAKSGRISFVLSPERTSGDEFQCLVADAESVYRVLRLLARDGRWHVGVGIGAVDHPLPSSVRESRGPALIAAREALDDAKSSRPSVAVRGEGARAEEAEGTVLLAAQLWEGRTPSGWEAVEAVEQLGESPILSEAARTLLISKQALSQRLQAANWQLESRSKPAVVAALSRADWN